MVQRQAPSSNYIVDHPSSCISTNKHSKLINKQKPHKIRIIHIMPPEIIQTDKANFRSLVQSLTGQSSSAPNTRIKKHQRSQVNSSSQNMSYSSGLSGSSSPIDIKFNPNKLFSDDLNHEQFGLDVESIHELLKIGDFEAKVEKDIETMVQTTIGPEWGMQEKSENEFCIDGFLELDEWLSLETKFPNLVPYVGSNCGNDLFGEF